MLLYNGFLLLAVLGSAINIEGYAMILSAGKTLLSNNIKYTDSQYHRKSFDDYRPICTGSKFIEMTRFAASQSFVTSL